MQNIKPSKWRFLLINDPIWFNVDRSALKSIIKRYRFKYNRDIDSLESIIAIDQDPNVQLEMRKEVLTTIIAFSLSKQLPKSIKLCKNYIISVYSISDELMYHAVDPQNYFEFDIIKNTKYELQSVTENVTALSERRSIINNAFINALIPKLFLRCPRSGLIIEIKQFDNRYNSYRIYYKGDLLEWVDYERYEEMCNPNFLIRKLPNFFHGLDEIITEFNYQGKYQIAQVIRLSSNSSEYEW